MPEPLIEYESMGRDAGRTQVDQDMSSVWATNFDQDHQVPGIASEESGDQSVRRSDGEDSEDDDDADHDEDGSQDDTEGEQVDVRRQESRDPKAIVYTETARQKAIEVGVDVNWLKSKGVVLTELLAATPTDMQGLAMAQKLDAGNKVGVVEDLKASAIANGTSLDDAALGNHFVRPAGTVDPTARSDQHQ